MNITGENENQRTPATDNGPVGPTDRSAAYPGDTDRVNGEYHYKNGFTQKIYSDAHYVPADESTVPPRYYTPPEKPVKEPKPPKPKKHCSPWIKVLCICLVCALLGGLAGGAIAEGRMNSRIEDMQTELNELKNKPAPAPVIMSNADVEAGLMSPSQIYDRACSQVVGITTEVTFTNFFGMTSSSAVSGSGFIISEDGYVLTNYHVIEYAHKGDTTATVMTHDGTRYDATIVGVEESNDVAVLKIDATGLTPVTIGNSDALSVGDAVYPVGNPLGELEFSMSSGHISALDRYITTDESGESINMFQMDAAVNAGNSGGPVFNSRGEVVGIVTAKYSDTGVEGLGFAIPINDAGRIAEDLITKGYVTGKAHMGVQIDQRYNETYSQYYGLPMGAYVYYVEKDSCAEKAGIAAGDIITSVDGKTVENYSELSHTIRQFHAGDTVDIVLHRAGKEMTVTITFDEAVPVSDKKNPAG